MSMADDRLSLPDETDSQSGALLPVNALPHSNGEWSGIAVKEASTEPARPDLTIYLHAMRRHWLMALGIGLLCAAIAGPAVYIAIGQQYTASSILHVSMQTDSVISSRDVPLVDRDRFEIYKSTQQESLLRRVVLQSALRKSEVKDIPIVQEKTLYGDPVDWLTGKLSVSFPGKAEIMLVSLSLEDPKEAQALVKAVVESYMTEVVFAETDRKQRRFDYVEKICGEKEQQIRNKREELKGLVATAGGSESPESLSTRQRLLFEELALYRNELARGSADIGRGKGELASQIALLKNVDDSEVPAMEIDQLVQADPVARQLSIELGWKKIDQAQTEQAVKPGATSQYVTQYSQQVARLQKDYDERLKLMEQKAKQIGSVKYKLTTWPGLIEETSPTVLLSWHLEWTSTG